MVSEYLNNNATPVTLWNSTHPQRGNELKVVLTGVFTLCCPPQRCRLCLWLWDVRSGSVFPACRRCTRSSQCHRGTPSSCSRQCGSPSGPCWSGSPWCRPWKTISDWSGWKISQDVWVKETLWYGTHGLTCMTVPSVSTLSSLPPGKRFFTVWSGKVISLRPSGKCFSGGRDEKARVQQPGHTLFYWLKLSNTKIILGFFFFWF